MYFKINFLSEIIDSDSSILGCRTIDGGKIKIGDVVYNVYVKYNNGFAYGYVKDIHLKYYKLDRSKQSFIPMLMRKRTKNKSRKL